MNTIKIVENFSKEDLFEKLKKVCLSKQPSVLPYSSSNFHLSSIKPSEIKIPQSYVLEDNLKNIWNLWLDLKLKGVDIFSLEGYVKIEVDYGDTKIIRDILPPVVEISEADGSVALLNDGMHRMYLPWLTNRNITVVFVEKVDSGCPYYALPFDGSFRGVKVLPGSIKPDGFDGKKYRLSGEEYKKLFRDFNSVFENVTLSRLKENHGKPHLG